MTDTLTPISRAELEVAVRDDYIDRDDAELARVILTLHAALHRICEGSDFGVWDPEEEAQFIDALALVADSEASDG